MLKICVDSLSVLWCCVALSHVSRETSEFWGVMLCSRVGFPRVVLKKMCCDGFFANYDVWSRLVRIVTVVVRETSGLWCAALSCCCEVSLCCVEENVLFLCFPSFSVFPFFLSCLLC